MRLSFLSLSFLLMMFSLSVSAGIVVDITLKEYVELDKADFLLGDIAELISSDNAVLRELKMLKVGTAPRYGFSKQYSHKEIEKVVAAIYHKEIDFQWSSQKTSKVKSRGVKLDLADIEHELEKQALTLVKKLDDGLSVFNIKKVETSAHIYLPNGPHSYHLVLPKTLKIKNRITGLVDFYIQNKRVKTLPISFELEVTRPVYIAKNGLSRRTAMSTSHYELAYVDVSKNYNAVASPMDDYEGYILTANKGKNSILMKHEIMKRPLIMKGELASVTVFGEKLNIQANAIAQNDANQGEQVVLMNNSGAVFNAVVANRGVAHVH